MSGSDLALIVNVSHLGPLDGDNLEGLLEIARQADGIGYEQLLMTDHVVLGTNLDSHAALGGPFPWPPEHPYPDPIVVLAAVAAVTTRIRLTTGVIIAPLRPAVLLAKQAATLDQLSNGRLELGLGTGWQLEEFDALGVPMEGKAARMDDLARACQTLWRNSPASFESPTVSFRDIYCRPLPVQPGGVPFWFAGGPNQAVARRVAELGEGWCPLNARDFAGLTRGLGLVRQEFERAGRDPATVGMRVQLPSVRTSAGASLDATLAQVDAYVEAGATAVVVTIGDFVDRLDEVRDALRQARDQVPRKLTPATPTS